MSDRHSISPYPIRMPPELRDRLEASARDGNRSLHAEIIARLAASYFDENREGQLTTATVAAFAEVEARMQKRMEEHLRAIKQASEELSRLRSSEPASSESEGPAE